MWQELENFLRVFKQAQRTRWENDFVGELVYFLDVAASWAEAVEAALVGEGPPDVGWWSRIRNQLLQKDNLLVRTLSSAGSCGGGGVVRRGSGILLGLRACCREEPLLTGAGCVSGEDESWLEARGSAGTGVPGAGKGRAKIGNTLSRRETSLTSGLGLSKPPPRAFSRRRIRARVPSSSMFFSSNWKRSSSLSSLALSSCSRRLSCDLEAWSRRSCNAYKNNKNNIQSVICLIKINLIQIYFK